jgi:hypothetical protein
MTPSHANLLEFTASRIRTRLHDHYEGAKTLYQIEEMVKKQISKLTPMPMDQLAIRILKELDEREFAHC